MRFTFRPLRGAFLKSMMKSIRRLLFWGTGLTLFVMGVVIYFTLTVNRPVLSEPNLGPMSLKTYYYSLKKIRKARENRPVGISLSPAETSYLLKMMEIELNQRFLTLRDYSLKSSGERARFNVVIGIPFGLFVRVRSDGIVRLKNGQWHVKVHNLWIGDIPWGWIFSGNYNPDFPTTFKSGAISLNSMTVDGKGTRAEIDLFKIDLASLLDKPSLR